MTQHATLRINHGCIAGTNTGTPNENNVHTVSVPGLMQARYDGQTAICAFDVKSYGSTGSTTAPNALTDCTGAATTEFKSHNANVDSADISSTFANATCSFTIKNTDCASLNFADLYSNSPGTTLVTAAGSTYTPVTGVTNGLFFSGTGNNYQTEINLINVNTSVVNGNAAGKTDTYISGVMLTPSSSTIQDYTCTAPDSNGNPTLESISISNQSSRCSSGSVGKLMSGHTCDILLTSPSATDAAPIKLYLESLGLKNASFGIVDTNGLAYTGATALTGTALKSHTLGEDYFATMTYKNAPISNSNTYTIDTFIVTPEGVDVALTPPVNQTNPMGVCDLLS